MDLEIRGYVMFKLRLRFQHTNTGIILPLGFIGFCLSGFALPVFENWLVNNRLSVSKRGYAGSSLELFNEQHWLAENELNGSGICLKFTS